jgi:hypothetical protein
MKRRQRHKERPVRVVRLWTRDEAEKALPYLRSIIASLREHWLSWQSHERDLGLLEQRKTGKPRDRLLAEQTAQDSCERSAQRFQDALGELSKIDVFLLDPVQGQALIPFRREDELAWFVFDNFDKKGLVGWRYQQDPIDKCRPLSPVKDSMATDSV